MKYVWGYAVMIVLTFGFVASDPCPTTAFARDEKCGTTTDQMHNGYFGGIAWPLYWAYKIGVQVRNLGAER